MLTMVLIRAILVSSESKKEERVGTYRDLTIQHPVAVARHASGTASVHAILVAVKRAVRPAPDSPLPVLAHVQLSTRTRRELEASSPGTYSMLRADARPYGVRTAVGDEQRDRRSRVVGSGRVLRHGHGRVLQERQ